MMKQFFAIILLATGLLSLKAQTTYQIDVDQPEKEILRGHLDLGGKNPAGEEISVNSYFIEKDGKPFFPIIGELHFSRYPEAYWEESILKMKAGGINVIASYVFWNVHEREEGKLDWSGDLNLRKFVKLIEKHDLYAIVRMGPFCHGEMRNGGLPDWLYGRPFEIRSNDTDYLAYVDSWYGEIADQIHGLLFSDGGPVIGVQLENEYQHSAAPWEFSYPGGEKELTVADRDAALAHEQIAQTDGSNPWSTYGKQHMNHLKEIAIKNGINVPLYTATGWGNATIVEKGSLPVTAGYAYPFWAEPYPSSFYLFKDIQKTPDYSPVSFDTDLYPSIPAEIGPGIQVKYSRRPFVPYESVSPLMVRIVGSGSNGIGYYMYHGGSTPQFDGKFYNEEANGVPRVNYDFQAPIGQYGQIRYHYKHLRMLHQFLRAYGDKLAPMKTVLPRTNADITPENSDALRYSVRSYGKSGFIFVINFQDHIEVKDIYNVNIKVQTGKETISFPASGAFDIPKGTSAIFPFNLALENVNVKSATVQPFTVLKEDSQNHYVFSSINGIVAELNFTEKTQISELKNASLSVVDGLKNIRGTGDTPFSFIANNVHFMIIPQEMAMNSIKIQEKLYISDALILEASNGLQLISQKTENIIHVFPEGKGNITCSEASITKEQASFEYFDTFSLRFKEIKPDVQIDKISERKYALHLNEGISHLNDLFINIDYVGDRALAFINGKMITDHLYHERKWEIGLKNFENQLKEESMIFIFHPMDSSASYLKDLNHLPKFTNRKHLEIKGFDIIPEYKGLLKLTGY